VISGEGEGYMSPRSDEDGVMRGRGPDAMTEHWLPKLNLQYDLTFPGKPGRHTLLVAARPPEPHTVRPGMGDISVSHSVPFVARRFESHDGANSQHMVGTNRQT
jgi:hypothetical protein